MFIDLQQLTPGQIYHTMTQSVIPRPIAWIVTENTEGDYNIAPFSYFTAISSDPPLLMVSIGNKAKDVPKDTAVNLKATGRCVIHIASSTQIDALNESSKTLDYGVSEACDAGIKLIAQEGFDLPRIKGAPVAMSGKVHQQHTIGNAPQHVFYIELEHIYIDDQAVIKDAKGRFAINAKAINPLARLGASEYSLLGELLVKKRPA